MSAMDHELEEHDRGLAYDLGTLLERRRALKLFAGAGLVALVGCGTGTNGGNGSEESAGSSSSTTGGSQTTDSTTDSSSASDASCSEIPEETAGPYPGDGSNGPNVLTESGIVRSDIRSSFGVVLAARPRACRCPIDAHRASTRPTAARRWPARRSTSGTATARVATRCTRRA